MFPQSSSAFQKEHNCHLPDVRVHRTQPAKLFLEHIAEHLRGKFQGSRALPENLPVELLVNQQLIDFARSSPRAGQRLLSMLSNYCLSRGVVDNPLASAIFKVSRELPCEQRVKQLEKLARASHAIKNRPTAGKLMSLVLLSSANDRDLLGLIKKSNLEKGAARLPQLDPYLDYYKIRRAFYGVSRPVPLLKESDEVTVQEGYKAVKSYVVKLKKALEAIPNIKSRWVYKLYLHNLNSAQQESRKLLCGAESPLECGTRINNFTRELAIETRLAISLERQNLRSEKPHTEAPRWSTNYLNALEESVRLIPVPLLIFTDRLNSIILMDRSQSGDRFGQRDGNGTIWIFEDYLKSKRCYLYGRHPNFITTLLHELGHGLHFRKSKLSSFKEVYSSDSNFNPIFQNELFINAMGWKMIPPGEFRILPSQTEVRIGNVTYPLKLKTEYQGEKVTFYTTGGNKAENFLVYQSGGELYHDTYGCSSPIEHFATAIVGYLLTPKDCAEKYPLTFAYFEQQFGKYAQTDLPERAFARLDNSCSKSASTIDWRFELPAGLSLVKKQQGDAKILSISSPSFTTGTNLSFQATSANEEILRQLMLDTLGTKLPAAAQNVFLVDRLLSLTKEGTLEVASNSSLNAGFLSSLCDDVLSRLSMREVAEIFTVQRVKKSNIYLVNAATSSLLAYAMMRFQEYDESTQFEKQNFSRASFKEWYSQNYAEQGKFSYYEDWVGFNFSGEVIREINANEFPDLTSVESYLLSKLAAVSADKFYVIGVSGDLEQATNQATLKQEIAHALWYLSADYQAAMQEQLAGLGNSLNSFKRSLTKMGYAKSKLADECHAYLLAGKDYFAEESAITMTQKLSITIERMQTIFNDYQQRIQRGCKI